MNVNELSGRLERLERENRRMKRAGLAVVGIALTVALIGATTPDEIPEVIEARAFRVIDENGNSRVRITAAGIGYLDENGFRAGITAGHIGYYDENFIERVRIDADGIGYYDENGLERARLGVVETVAKKADQKSRYPAGVALFDDEGNVIWPSSVDYQISSCI